MGSDSVAKASQATENQQLIANVEETDEDCAACLQAIGAIAVVSVVLLSLYEFFELSDGKNGFFDSSANTASP